MFREKIHEYIETHKVEIINELKALVSIPSIRGEKKEDAPFGEGCKYMLERVQKLYEREGVKTKINQAGGYLLSCFGEGKTIGIFAHSDVVNVADDWVLTMPFEPIEKDGYIVGRGTLDDKSAIISSLYSLKIIKELEIPFNSRLMCFTGANEETGMADVKNFLKNEEKPIFSLVADTGFPLYRGNKGKLIFSTKSKSKLSQGIKISGGTGATVIGDAEAIIPFSQALLDEVSSYCNDRVSVEHNENTILVKGNGIPKHSALPEGSLSGAALVSGVLKNCNSISESDREIFESIYNISNVYYGETFGIEDDNKEFGKLTCVLVDVDTENDGTVDIHINIRRGDTLDKECLIKRIEDKLLEMNWDIPTIKGYSNSKSIPKSNPFVQRLLSVYSDCTGEKNPECYVNAGGTYREYLEDAVEIGVTNIWGCPKGLPQGHGSAHQPDESINIEGFLNAVEITVNMILECDKIVNEEA